MTSSRAAIDARLKQVGANKRALALSLKNYPPKPSSRVRKTVSQSRLYDFLAGKSPIGAHDLETILAALGLGIYPHEDVDPSRLESDAAAELAGQVNPSVYLAEQERERQQRHQSAVHDLYMRIARAERFFPGSDRVTRLKAELRELEASGVPTTD